MVTWYGLISSYGSAAGRLFLPPSNEEIKEMQTRVIDWWSISLLDQLIEARRSNSNCELLHSNWAEYDCKEFYPMAMNMSDESTGE